jgi:hypothetical protein
MKTVRCTNCQALQRRVHVLQAENDRLRCQLDTALRAGKRQAAPFAKGQPAAQPKKPGRKPGKDYGPKAHHQGWQPDLDWRASPVGADVGVADVLAARAFGAGLPRSPPARCTGVAGLARVTHRGQAYAVRQTLSLLPSRSYHALIAHRQVEPGVAPDPLSRPGR